MTVYTNSDYKLDQGKIQGAFIAVAQSGMSVRLSGPAFTNADVLRLKAPTWVMNSLFRRSKCHQGTTNWVWMI